MSIYKKSTRRRDILTRFILIAIIVTCAASSTATLWAMTLQIPDFDTFFQERSLTQSTKLYDRTGKVLLYDVFGNARRTVVALSDISPHAQHATIAIEDADFYNHNGIKLSSIARAFLVNVGSGELRQGGSTLTQQVIKNTLLTQDKKISRKIKEVLLSLKLERTMPKNDILALYLNESPYGGNIYGIEEAAASFLGKRAKDLTIAESAYLAALPQAPTYLSPYGKHRDKLEERKNLTLKKMYELGYISKTDYETAQKEKVTFLPPEGKGIKAPHFVFYVIDELQKEYSEETLKNNGFKVITSLDWEIQQKAEAIIAKYGPINQQGFGAKNAGLVITDPKTGQILAMVGSRDYFDIDNEGNFNVATAKRQPGSTFKPFIYATAFMKGYTPETVVFDLPTEFNTNCSPTGQPETAGAVCYTPENYDGKFMGPVTLRKALANSRNIPAVKTLYLAGIADSLKTAEAMGITTLTDPKRYGLSLVLGGGEVTLLEMTSAYSVFANDGVRNETASILQIINPQGVIVKEYKPNPKQVIPANTARQITHILKDNEARQPAYSPNSVLNIPGHDVAVKTGTTNNYRDAWIIGYTPSLTLGVWVGNNDNTPMDKKVAGQIVAPVWNELMVSYLSGKPNELFNNPDPTPTNIKPILRGIWQGGDITINGGNEYVTRNVHSILYWVDKNNPLGSKPANPYNDAQFRLWEAPVRSWAANQGLIDDSSLIPTNQRVDQSPTNIQNQNTIPVSLNSLNTEGYTQNDLVTLSFEADSSSIRQADFFINNTLINSTTKSPFKYTFIPSELDNLERSNEVKVIIYDRNRNRGEAKGILLIK